MTQLICLSKELIRDHLDKFLNKLIKVNKIIYN